MITLTHKLPPVSRICLGTAGAGSGLSRDDFFGLLDRFIDAGGSFVDTANVYGRWMPDGLNHSEMELGAYIASRGKRLTIATKGGHYALSDRRDRITREDLTYDVDTSLSALGVDTLDLYYLHRDDPKLPVGEICEMLGSFVKAGKITALGASNWAPSRVEAFNAYAAAHGLPGFAAVSNQHALAKVNKARNNNPDPTLWICDEEELAFHARTGIPLIPYQATARGYLAKIAAGEPVDAGLAAAFGCEENDALAARLNALSRETGLSVQTLTITELVKSVDFPLIPVVGVSRPAQMDDVISALQVLGK